MPDRLRPDGLTARSHGGSCSCRLRPGLHRLLRRHCFAWVIFSQTTEAVIAGCEAAWAFFGEVFATVIPDNLSAVVDKANSIEPRFNQAFVEYAQSRGFVVDPARVRRPQDRPRVEQVVPYVRACFFAGERFVDRNVARPSGWSHG